MAIEVVIKIKYSVEQENVNDHEDMKDATGSKVRKLFGGLFCKILHALLTLFLVWNL